MIGKKILFAVIGLSVFSLFAATRPPMDVPVKTVDELIPAIADGVSGDRILIAPGTYDLTGRQMAQSGGSAVKSHLSVTKVYSFLGQGAKPEDTVLKGDGDTHRVMMINTSAGTVVSNLTFTNGKCTDNGGAVLVYAGATEFVDCRFLKCHGSSGGAIYSKVTGAVARNCWFVDNYSGAGGGTYACDTENCTFTNNLVKGTGGGAYKGYHVGSRFYFNGAIGSDSSGGGAVGETKSVAPTTVCVDCEFIGNTNTMAESHGAVIYYAKALTNCTFVANEGVDGVVQGASIVSGCSFSDNNSGSCCRWCKEIDMCRFVNDRQAVTVTSTSYGYPETWVRNSLIKGQIYSSGYANGGDGVAYFENCTLVDNSFKNAPLSSGAVAVNCAFSGNLPQDIYSSSYPDMTNCLYITRSGTAELTKAFHCQQVADMKFKDPANGDYSPKGVRSPLYNAGYEDDGYLAAIGKTDCAKKPRVMFDRVDIGAFEMQEKQGLTVIFR